MPQPLSELIVLAYDWPGFRGGYRLSCWSVTTTYLSVFDRVHYIAVADRTFDHEDQWADKPVSWTHVATVRHARAIRFLTSLVGKQPAVTSAYRRVHRHVTREIRRIRDETSARQSKLSVVLEDVPMACYLPMLRNVLPGVPIALSSHNLFTEVFEKLTHRGSIISRIAWRIESARVSKFERDACLAADRMWSITEDEGKQYERVLGIVPDGTFFRGLNATRYKDVPSGDPETVTHVGTANLIKGAGIADFLRDAWPYIRSKVPNARLVIAGRGTEIFNDPASGVEGLGFVEDDVDILARGATFLNPQVIGAGLQFKSVVAMLAGKALIATPMSLDGVEGTNDVHFIQVRDMQDSVERIIRAMTRPDETRRIARAGQELMLSMRGQEAAQRKAAPLARDLAALATAVSGPGTR